MCRCWTQHIRSLVNFIIYLEPPYVLDYNYIVVPLPTGFFVSAYFNGEGVQEFLTTSSQRFVFTISETLLLLINNIWVIDGMFLVFYISRSIVIMTISMIDVF